MTYSIKRALLALSAISLLAVPTLAQSSSAPHNKATQMTTMSSSEKLNADYNDFLGKYVVASGDINLVKYADVSNEDKAKLDRYIDALSKSGPPNGSDAAIMAYWFNLYNAETVSVIIDNYPVNSIREIGGSLFSPGPWGTKTLTVAGKPMSLNDIEHGTVRKQFNEPRIHYGFNCASIGCPNLKTTAWTAETFEADLTQAAKDFINSPRGISVDNKGRVTASSIFKWYKEDFGGTDAKVLAHAAPYAAAETKTALQSARKIHNFDYDWSLNIAK